MLPVEFVFFVRLCFCVSPNFSTVTFAIESKKTPTRHKKKERKNTHMSAEDPNGRTPRGTFPNDTVNIITLENQIIKGGLARGKIKTNSEDRAGVVPRRIRTEAGPDFRRFPAPQWMHHITVCPAQRERLREPRMALKRPIRKDRLKKGRPLNLHAPLPYLSLKLHPRSENIC